jgi:hypothetical protein
MSFSNEALILLCLGAIFVIGGGYFGIIEQKVGLRRFAPLYGETARLWGVIMVFVGAMLWLVAFT